MKNRRYTFLALLFLFTSMAVAQQPVWQNIGIDQGLPDPNVTAILKASDGRLYVGTAIGLFSYDGYTFRKVELSANKKINPYINALQTDGNSLFVGARDALIRLRLSDHKTTVLMNPLNTIGGAITLYLNKEKTKLFSFGHGGVLVLNIESEGLQIVNSDTERTIHNLRIVSDTEIHAFCSSKKFIRIRNHVISFLFADKGILDAQWWEKEQAWLVVKADGLYLLDNRYKTLKKINLPIDVNTVENRWLYPDQNGGFWIQAAGRFAFLKSASSANLEFFENEAGNPYSFTSNTAQAFFTEPNGMRWVGGDGTGLSYLPSGSSKIRFLTNEKTGVQHFWCFRYEKASRKLLCGTSSGLVEGTLENNMFINQKTYIPAGYDRFSVNAIVELNANEYLISVFKAGYWIFNKENKHFKQLSAINQQIGSLFVFGITEVSGNRLVLCTQNSAYVLDKATLKLSRFIQPALHNYSIYTVIEDSQRQFMMAGGFGLQIFNANLRQEKYFSKNDTLSGGLPGNVIFDLKEIGNHKYLLATMGSGLCIFQEDSNTFHTVKLVTDPDNIFGIMQLNANTFVLTTSNGLCRYDMNTGKSVMLNKTNFLPFNDFNQSAFYHDADFTMVGGEKGMLLINSKDLDSVFSFISEIIIRYKGKNIQSLELEPDEHSIHLDLSLSEIVPMAKRKFRYRISGLDDSWQTLPAAQNTLSYNYLPPGKYTLEVELDDETGLYKTQQRLVPVVVKPYFYQTLWFSILALLLVIGFIFVIVRYFALMRLRWKLNRMDAERKIMLERSRISRELHDNLGSQLTYMISGLETTDLLLKRNKIDKTGQNLEKLQLAARESMQQLRDSIWALNPGTMTLFSLGSQYEKWLNRVTEPFEQLHCSFTKPDCTDFTIDPLIGLNIFRIMQEAVNNVLKHSGATQVSITMSCDETFLTIIVSDNGKGISVKSEEGTGLSSMRQRAGSMKANLEIINSVDGGVKIVLKAEKNTLKG